MIRIAIDASGDDCGSRVILEGAPAAERDLPIGLILVGPAAEVRAGRDRGRVDLGADIAVVDPGGSSARTARNAVAQAHRFAAGELVSKISRRIAATGAAHG